MVFTRKDEIFMGKQLVSRRVKNKYENWWCNFGERRGVQVLIFPGWLRSDPRVPPAGWVNPKSYHDPQPIHLPRAWHIYLLDLESPDPNGMYSIYHASGKKKKHANLLLDPLCTWRTLKVWKGHVFHHPKKVTSRIARCPTNFRDSSVEFLMGIDIHPKPFQTENPWVVKAVI